MKDEGVLIFERPAGGYFQISSSVAEAIMSHAQDTPHSCEAGGVLVGRFIRDADDVSVDDITTPMQGDLRSRFHFFRAQEGHQKVIDEKWAESRYTATYLGEWHTHPEDDPWPSCTDWWNWSRKLMTDQFGSHLFFVIVGTRRIRVWEGRYRRPGLRQLDPTS